MKISFILIIINIFFCRFAEANMASPIQKGSEMSEAFSSRNVDILKEILTIALDKNLTTAKFVAEYFVKTDRDGVQMPLIFHAINLSNKDSFKVWVDNIETNLISDINNYDFQKEYNYLGDSFFKNLSVPFKGKDYEDVNEKFHDKIAGFHYSYSDLKYFEINLTKGEHTIRVEYTANAWTDRSEWVKEYEFKYSLLPARYWKSFGELKVVLNTNNTDAKITTNLDDSNSENIKTNSKWSYNKIPVDLLEIKIKPQISSFAKILIQNTPFELTLISGIILFLLHFFTIRLFIKTISSRQYSVLMISGCIFIPLLILVIWYISYGFTDSVIGVNAGRYHGYNILVFIFYPVILIIYSVLIYLSVKIILKRKNITEKILET